MAESAMAIRAEHLTHAYDDKTVLHGLDFEVPWGQVCGFLGPNGAGKTTTLHAIAGILEPRGGRVSLDGRNPRTDLAARALLGFVPDSGGLYGLLTPREHLGLVADLHELSAVDTKRNQDALVERFEVGKFLDQRIDTLSKGQRQRVALCCGLLHRPRIVLLDEPLSGLDVKAGRVLRDTITELAEDGAAVLYCSHLLDVVERVCHRAIILSEGRIVADAPTSELVDKSADHTLESVFHALTRTDDVAELKGLFGGDA